MPGSCQADAHQTQGGEGQGAAFRHRRHRCRNRHLVQIHDNEAGDGGGGEFYYDISGAETVNNGTVIDPDDGVGQWIRLIGPTLNVKWFGAKGDNTSDDTDAIQAALDDSMYRANMAVIIPVGRYKTTSALVCKVGTAVWGQAGQGSTEQFGVTLMVNHNGNGIEWNPTNGVDYAGNGAQLTNVLILKANGYTGGDAIKILCVSDIRRIGDVFMENVLVAASGTGMWARGLHADGSACNTSGAKGVRTGCLIKFRVAVCSTNYEYILLNQVTHWTGMGVALDQASGSGSPGITLMGESANIDLDVRIGGKFYIPTGATIDDFCLRGRVSDLDVQETTVNGVANITAGDLVNKSTDFVVNSNRSPIFNAALTSSAANVTGDGTAYPITGWTEDFDKNGEFDPATGVFTCHMAGFYRFEAAVLLSNMGAAHTLAEMEIETNSEEDLEALLASLKQSSLPLGAKKYRTRKPPELQG